MPPKEGNCWGKAEAERRIHGYAARENDEFELAYTRHATQRMAERGIIVADLMYILARGRIVEDPTESTQPGFCKYKICGKSPNSGAREICLIVIPDPDRPAAKVVTVMWRDLE